MDSRLFFLTQNTSGCYVMACQELCEQLRLDVPTHQTAGQQSSGRVLSRLRSGGVSGATKEAGDIVIFLIKKS